jgi:hypothetical protein
MKNPISKQTRTKKCFYCQKEATNITIDDEGVMFYLCERHLKLFTAIYPKKGYDSRQKED